MQTPLEQNIETALNAIKWIQSLLDEAKHNNTVPPSTPILLQATVDPNSESLSFETSFGRELWFCCLHAVNTEPHVITGSRRFCHYCKLIYTFYFHIFDPNP